jgi:hypothetical protein
MTNHPSLTMTTIQIELPEAIAQAAQDAGLLTPQSLERLFTRAIEQRQAGNSLLALAEQIAAAGIEPMSMEEINAEVKAYRAERRQRAESGHVPTDTMKDEYGLTNAQQGQFYKADMRLIPPVRLEPQVLDFLVQRAQTRGTTLNVLLNDVLTKTLELMELGR